MSKRPSRKTRKPRKCIFCGINNANSKEHFYSNWMASLLAPGPEGQYVEHGYSHGPIAGITDPWQVERQGEVHNKKIRVVCVGCNTGWMKRQEDECLPFLKSLITGERVALDATQQQSLARWVATKVICSEHNRGDDSVTPFSDRNALKEKGIIPPYFNIYVSNHSDPNDTNFLRHAGTVSKYYSGPSPALDGVVKNVQQIGFLMGRTFILVNAARVDDFKLEHHIASPAVFDRLRIFPPQNAEITWPCQPILTTEDLRDIVYSLDALLRSPGVHWTEGPAPSN